MTVDKKIWNLWKNISFKTTAYRKNFDLIDNNDNIITHCDGIISKLRIDEQKKPLIIGEYMISIWNVELVKMLNLDIITLLYNYKFVKSYNELLFAINNNYININDYDKIVFINTFVLHKEYRKCGIVDEFFEMIYREFYNKNTLILTLALPFQYNPIDFDYFKYRKFLYVDDDKKNKISGMNYYGLNNFFDKNNIETNTHKIHSILEKYDFNQIKNTNLFIFNPNYFIKRITYKTINNNRIESN